jgi:hypothetical protein
MFLVSWLSRVFRQRGVVLVHGHWLSFAFGTKGGFRVKRVAVYGDAHCREH